MPKIDILEDELVPVDEALGTDIPYIPGFSVKSGAPTEPTLIETVLDFEKTYGEQPAKITDADGSTFLDKSYIMAKELLAAGMPIYYHKITNENTIAAFYPALYDYLTPKDSYATTIADKGEYSIKYITTGGYANYGVSAGDAKGSRVDLRLIEIAASRGDCIALIEDNAKNTAISPTSRESFFSQLEADKDMQNLDSSFAAAFTPWAEYRLNKTYEDKAETGDIIEVVRAEMPACFGYLLNLASNIKVSPNWLAMAGTTRGLIPNIIGLKNVISNKVADAYQPVIGERADTRALNAITNIQPYGLTIWGNRTLKTIGTKYKVSGTHFLNTRNMISDIKKVAYRVAKSLIYEQNTDRLWLNFKSLMAPYLDQLKSGSGISDYKLLKASAKKDGSKLGNEEFACAIKIFPIYAVEAFEITVVISDVDVAVE